MRLPSRRPGTMAGRQYRRSIIWQWVEWPQEIRFGLVVQARLPSPLSACRQSSQIPSSLSESNRVSLSKSKHVRRAAVITIAIVPRIPHC